MILIWDGDWGKLECSDIVIMILNINYYKILFIIILGLKCQHKKLGWETQ